MEPAATTESRPPSGVLQAAPTTSGNRMTRNGERPVNRIAVATALLVYLRTRIESVPVGVRISHTRAGREEEDVSGGSPGATVYVRSTMAVTTVSTRGGCALLSRTAYTHMSPTAF